MYWSEMVQSVNSSEVYRKIVEHMFEDNIFSDGRITVLSIFTNDVCIRYLQVADEILQIQILLLKKSKWSEKSKMALYNSLIIMIKNNEYST